VGKARSLGGNEGVLSVDRMDECLRVIATF
jgi:hypothetical protein